MHGSKECSRNLQFICCRRARPKNSSQLHITFKRPAQLLALDMSPDLTINGHYVSLRSEYHVTSCCLSAPSNGWVPRRFRDTSGLHLFFQIGAEVMWARKHVKWDGVNVRQSVRHSVNRSARESVIRSDRLTVEPDIKQSCNQKHNGPLRGS
jgi:hypothetical protein